MNEHLDAGDDLGSPLLGQLQQPRFGGIVHHIKDIAGIDLFVLEGSFPGISHPDRGGVDDHIEGQFLQVRPFHNAGAGLVS